MYSFSKKSDVTEDSEDSRRAIHLEDNRPRSVAQRMLAADQSPAPQSQGVIQLKQAAAEKYHMAVGVMNRVQLNITIDDTDIEELDRVAAEERLKNIDETGAAQVASEVREGRLNEALVYATSLAGLDPNHYSVRSTDNYASVIPPGTEMPGGGNPSGVTVMEHGAPVIYIHQAKIREWVLNGDIGNLLSTIRHEGRHAGQNREGAPAPGKTDEREFEAYAEEISSALKLAINAEDVLLPSSAHIMESHDSAVAHYNRMTPEVQPGYADRYAQMTAQYNRLIGTLVANDENSGRVARIAGKVRALLNNYLNGTSHIYPHLAYNEYMKIPRRFRLPLDAEFNPLLDQAADKNRTGIMTGTPHESKSSGLKTSK